MSKWERQSREEDYNIARNPKGCLIKWIFLTLLFAGLLTPGTIVSFMNEQYFVAIFVLVLLIFFVAGGIGRIKQCIDEIKK